MYNSSNRIRNVIKLLIAFLVIYLSGSVIVVIGEAAQSAFRNISLILFILMIGEILLDKQFRFDKDIILLIIALALYWAFSYVRYPVSAKNLFTRLVYIILFCMYFYTKSERICELVLLCNNVILLLSYIALCIFILTEVFRIKIPSSHYGGLGFADYDNYLGIYYVITNAYYDLFSIQIHRMQSIFWEPGVYAIMLNLSLFYGLFYKKCRIFNIFVLSFCIILTFSTTGIICMLLIYFGFVLSKINRVNRNIICIPLAVLTLAAIAALIVRKRNLVGNTSFSNRSIDLYYGLKLWLKNFWIGNGFNNGDEYLNFNKLRHSNSNGLIALAYNTGIVGLSFFLYPFVCAVFKSENVEKLKWIVFITVIILINMSEPFYSRPVTLMVWSVLLLKFCIKGKMSKVDSYAFPK